MIIIVFMYVVCDFSNFTNLRSPLPVDTGETLVARSCGFESKSVCGNFMLADNESSESGGMRSLHGCIDTCAGPDGCNDATTTIILEGMVVLVICLLIPLKIF